VCFPALNGREFVQKIKQSFFGSRTGDKTHNAERQATNISSS
jgi:hypothetical protein